jgi:hypothetical protein
LIYIVVCDIADLKIIIILLLKKILTSHPSCADRCLA